MGAMEPGRWQLSQDFWKMGAMSLLNVGVWAKAMAALKTVSVAVRTILIPIDSFGGRNGGYRFMIGGWCQ